jgi:hypothetical protein
VANAAIDLIGLSKRRKRAHRLGTLQKCYRNDEPNENAGGTKKRLCFHSSVAGYFVFGANAMQ